MGGGGDPADNLSQPVGPPGQQVATARSGQGSPSRSNFPACSGAPGCQEVGCESPGQGGCPFASASFPSLTPTKPGAPSMSLPRSSPLTPAHPSRETSIPVRALQPLCPRLSPPSWYPTSPCPHGRTFPHPPCCHPGASPPPPHCVPRGAPTRPQAQPQPHRGLSHAALPILHPAAHSPRHQVTPGAED